MPTDPHRLSPAARSVAVYLGDELTAFIQDPVVRDRIVDRWAQEMDDAGLLSGSGHRRLARARRRRKSWTRVVLRLFSRV